MLVYFVADRYSLVYTLGDRPLYTGLLTDLPGSSVAYRSSYTLSLTDIPVYTPSDRPLYPGLQTSILGNSVADMYSYTCRWPVFEYALQVTGGYTWVQWSLQILLYFVADRHSGPSERQLYPKLQTYTVGYSVADTCIEACLLECIPDYRSATKYMKTCKLHCALLPGISVSNPVYSGLLPKV